MAKFKETFNASTCMHLHDKNFHFILLPSLLRKLGRNALSTLRRMR